MTSHVYFLDFDDGLIFKFFVEYMACMMFHFIGSINATPWANGIALIVLVYFTAKISGSHLNPAVSATFMLLGYINPLEMLVYWIAQIAGCISGALWIAALVPQIQIGEKITTDMLPVSGCFFPKTDLSYAQVFGWEAVCTFCFILPIFAVVWYTQHKSGYGNTGPFIVGCSFMASAYVACNYTGAAFNPARVLGSYVVFKCPETQFIKFYIFGEFAASITVPFFIIPWYGIAMDNWYFKYFPTIKDKLVLMYSNSKDEIESNNNEDIIVSPEKKIERVHSTFSDDFLSLGAINSPRTSGEQILRKKFIQKHALLQTLTPIPRVSEKGTSKLGKRQSTELNMPPSSKNTSLEIIVDET